MSSTITATIQLVQLPDGSTAAIVQQISYGDVVVIVLLASILFFQLYALWTRRGY